MLRHIKPSEIPKGRNKSNPDIMNDLREFMATSAMAAEVRFPETQRVKYAYAAYYHAIKRNGYPIQAMIREGKLYLRKKTALGAGTPKGG